MKFIIVVMYISTISVNVVAEETTVEVDVSCVNDSCTTVSLDLEFTDTEPTVVLNSESSTKESLELMTEKAPTASPVRQNGSSKMSTTIGSKLTTPSPTTVTTVTTTTDSTVPQQFQNKTSEPCSCDQIDGECEVNCCCDPDCDSTDLNVFSYCRTDQPSPPSDFCLTTDIIYRNTTVYTLTQSENRLFCVDTHNIPHSLKFSNQKVVVNEEGFSKLLKHKKLFKWNLQQTESYSYKTLETKPYKYGSPLIIFRNESSDFSFSHFVLLGESTSSMCTGVDRIKYLENDKTSCLLKVPLNKEECEGNPMFNPSAYCLHQLISSPDLYNKSLENIENITIPFSLYLCDGGSCEKVSELPETVFDSSKSMCLNVTKSVKYSFQHNGTGGIVNASCYIETISLAIRKDFMRIYFDVNFEWAKEVKNSFPRSGRPGYLAGKPVISGTKTGKKDIRGREIFTFSKHPDDWFKILWTHNGSCSAERRHIIIGENVKSQCLIKVPVNETKTQKGCSSLHNKVLEFLLGMNNASDEVWLSSWGDPDLISWAPLIFTPPSQAVFSNKCLAVASTIHIRIVTAYVGPVYAPQMKIVGAMGDVRNSPLLCDSEMCSVIAVSTVTFTDHTSSPVATFAKPPIIHFHLPHDFFYPFSIGSSSVVIKLSGMLCFLNVLFTFLTLT